MHQCMLMRKILENVFKMLESCVHMFVVLFFLPLMAFGGMYFISPLLRMRQ